MPELLLELLSEEIPARMQDRARADLERLVTEGLKEAGLGHGDVWTFSTPRRIGLSVAGLPERQPDVRQERKGPRVGSPDKAIEGFLRSVGFDSLAQCERREAKGAEFWFAVIERKGAATADALGGIVTGAIRAMGWPKSMRWGGSAFQWVRPLHNILCIFDGAPVGGSFDIGGGGEALAFNGTTVGHRFLAPGEIAVESAADYRTKLEKAFVLVDPDERRARIEAQAGALAASLGSSLREDRALLNEVTGLVEWPVAVAGRIDAAFMNLPPEVLITSMRSHQKYFALETAGGQMAPHFIAIADMETGDGGKSVAAGNERVLRARLADAQFFWDQDRATPLADRVEALEGITFHARLGSVRKRVHRIQELVGIFASSVGADTDQAQIAALLAKADLTTGMVGEFPELQGVMGRYYAINDGENASVADAVAGHYAPQGPSDVCPSNPVTVAVALADKIDMLASFWLIGETPTGSRDPYGLRRAALGVIRLIVENELRLSLVGLLEKAAVRASELEPGQLAAKSDSVPEEAAQQAFRFIVDRLKVHLRDRGVRHDHVAAVFADGGEDDLVRLLSQVDALAALLGSEDGGNLLTGYRRAANILRIEEKKDGRSYEGAPAARLLKVAEETDLSKALDTAAAGTQRALEKEAFGEAMTALAGLRGPIDRFFDVATVNDPDPALRENRLLLLSNIRAVMDSVADFSRIEG
ncbi:MAG: glycine--tRNA ligase subunit beta [Rhodospirillaceae bacterium]|nr:glycine--tRNA ligase subunit beta [Rhodospirillaceae bacterium]MYB12445.1 glycine--tRNA ligase subunit beta [Rhodospirillaceae bacterium]MYI51097.1 glycine--tRNA ligase subunit beta [Rhodospirillaceae bacterium]